MYLPLEQNDPVFTRAFSELADESYMISGGWVSTTVCLGKFGSYYYAGPRLFIRIPTYERIRVSPLEIRGYEGDNINTDCHCKIYIDKYGRFSELYHQNTTSKNRDQKNFVVRRQFDVIFGSVLRAYREHSNISLPDGREDAKRIYNQHDWTDILACQMTGYCEDNIIQTIKDAELYENAHPIDIVQASILAKVYNTTLLTMLSNVRLGPDVNKLRWWIGRDRKFIPDDGVPCELIHNAMELNVPFKEVIARWSVANKNLQANLSLLQEDEWPGIGRHEHANMRHVRENDFDIRAAKCKEIRLKHNIGPTKMASMIGVTVRAIRTIETSTIGDRSELQWSRLKLMEEALSHL